VTINEVDHITGGIGRDLRAVLSAALALAQLQAQRRARATEELTRQAQGTEREVTQRVVAERQLHAARIPSPTEARERGVEEQARAWAEASAHRDVAPERAREWDADLRAMGVDPDRIRDTSDWLAAQAERRAETMDTAAELHDVAAADLLIAGDRESDREHDPRRARGQSEQQALAEQAEHHAAATTDYDAAGKEARAAHADDMNATAERQQGQSEAAALSDRWDDGAPPAQLAGKAHPVGRASDTRRQTVKPRRRGTPTRTATHTRDSGLSR
jgi:hypothetical protein